MRRLLLGAFLAALTSMAAPAVASACDYTAGEARIALPGRPFAAAVSSDGCWIFAALLSTGRGADGAIAVLHNQNGAFVLQRVAQIKGAAGGLALTHDGAILAVAAQDTVAILDVAKLEVPDGDPVMGYIPDDHGAGAIFVTVSQDDRLLFIADEREARITVADLSKARTGSAKDAVLGHVPQGAAPVGLALSKDGRWLIAADEIAPAGLDVQRRCTQAPGGPLQREGAVSVIDVEKAASNPGKALLGFIPVGCSPVRVALAPDGGTAWVTVRGDDAVIALDTAKLFAGQPGAIRAKVAVGSAPVGVMVRPDGAQVWVTNSDRFEQKSKGSIALIDPAALSVVKTETTGAFPRDLRFLPDGVTLVSSIFGGSAIHVEPTAGLSVGRTASQ